MNEIDTIGTIALFNGTTAPEGWLFCDGQLLENSKYEVLLSVIGYSYGGNEYTNFALPKLSNVGSCRYMICYLGAYPSRPSSGWGW